MVFIRCTRGIYILQMILEHYILYKFLSNKEKVLDITLTLLDVISNKSFIIMEKHLMYKMAYSFIHNIFI